MDLNVIATLASYYKEESKYLKNSEDNLNLDRDTYKKYLKKLTREYSDIHIRGGEPLLNGDLLYLIRYSVKRFPLANVHLHTNGYFLFNNSLDVISENGLTDIIINGNYLDNGLVEDLNELVDRNKLSLRVEFYEDYKDLYKIDNLQNVKDIIIYTKQKNIKKEYNRIKISKINSIKGIVITKNKIYKTYTGFLKEE